MGRLCVPVHSVVELLQGGTSGLSVLRTFRLLRILKLVRFMPALRYQLVVMLRTMDNVAMFFILLLLFIFIFRSQQQQYLITDCVGGERNAIGRVRQSSRLIPPYLSNQLAFDLSFLQLFRSRP